MKTVQKLNALALGLALSVSAWGSAQTAQADGGLSLTTLNSVAALQGEQQGIVHVKTQPLYRFQDRPWARMPLGVAITVKAPPGTTMADLHNRASQCGKQDSNAVWCVKGAAIHVSRNGGLYVINVTSQDRVTAAEIQKRAK